MQEKNPILQNCKIEKVRIYHCTAHRFDISLNVSELLIFNGENTSLGDAKKQAVNDILQNIANEDGITYKIIGKSSTDIENRNENGEITTNVTLKYEGKTIINGKEI